MNSGVFGFFVSMRGRKGSGEQREARTISDDGPCIVFSDFVWRVPVP